MNKKGMTLIELLAVVGVLAMLMVIAIPNAVDAYKESKKKNFLTDVQTVYKTAIDQSKIDNYGKRSSITYARLDGQEVDTLHSLDLTGSTKMNFVIVVEYDGTVSSYYASDGEFQYSNDEVPIEDVSQITVETIHMIAENEERALNMTEIVKDYIVAR